MFCCHRQPFQLISMEMMVSCKMLEPVTFIVNRMIQAQILPFPLFVFGFVFKFLHNPYLSHHRPYHPRILQPPLNLLHPKLSILPRIPVIKLPWVTIARLQLLWCLKVLLLLRKLLLMQLIADSYQSYIRFWL